MRFTEEQTARYSRHILLPQVGGEGQERICNASVLVVGAGGLGCPAIYYLAAAGVGRLTVVDGDTVSASDLHRQILYHSNEIGAPKVEAASARVKQLNPDVDVVPIAHRMTRDNARDLIRDCDVVVDGSDNAETKFLLNDVCVDLSVPLVHGGVIRFEGQVTTVPAGGKPCLRCLYADAERFEEDALETCSQSGVLGAVAGLIGTVQAAEALKAIVGAGEPLGGRMLVVDAGRCRFRTIGYEPRPDCPACGGVAAP